MNDCIGCEIGTVVTTNNGQGNVLCTACSAGQYRTTYSSNVGDTCTDCEVGKFITDDQLDPLQHDDPMDCNTCPAGFQYDTKAACVICEGGTYQDENNITAVTCKQCPMNTFLADDKGEGVAHDNFGDCMDCPNGKFAPPGTFWNLFNVSMLFNAGFNMFSPVSSPCGFCLFAADRRATVL